MAVGDIGEFELRLREFMDTRYPEVLETIRNTGNLAGDTEQQLQTALTQLLAETGN